MKSDGQEKIVFKFTINGSSATDLLVYFILKSKFKNNFTVGPLLTNVDGVLELSCENLEKAINSAEYNYPMDYSGLLVDCTNILVLVETLEELRQRISRLREFYPKDADALEDMVNHSSNHSCAGKRLVCQLPIAVDLVEVALDKI